MPTLIPSSEDVRIYECAVLYPYPFNQKEEQDLLKEVEGYFDEVGAKQIAKDAWGRRGLAYPIEGFSEGSFVIYYYEIDPLKVKEVDQALRIQKNVLRHMFVKPPKHYQIVKFGEAYEKWLKERETVGEVRAREKEEKVKEQVAKKAKRQAKISTEKKKPEAQKPVEEGVITEQIDKLISDDTYEL